MDFRILGGLEVRDRGKPIELRRPKQRALLAILLLRPGESISSDVLIEALWGEDVPRTARAALQNYVAQLRRALGPGLIVSRGGGYALDAASEQIDLSRFERLVGDARASEGEQRVEKLREALALWRGPPLADLAFEPFAVEETRRLEEQRTAALEDLIDAELALGAGADLVGKLESLIAEHPFRERFRGQLMLALYRAGRQADALEAYQATRQTLVDELGIEPSEALRELEQAILRQDPALSAPAGPTSVTEAPEERRKTVTVLFADLSYPGEIDPELLRRSSVEALSRARDVLVEHGATTEQRASDEVMAVFGIPRSHEDDPLRAARAALDLQAAIGRAGGDLARRGMELRIGIETGEVLSGADEAGHGFISGPAIGLAKRLFHRARPGELVIGPATMGLLGGAVLSEPADGGREEASLLLGLVEDATAPPRHLEAPLVGRGAELAALHAAFERVAAERTCGLALILGEPGIGKTRLARELYSELEGNATVLVGRCMSYGKGATYLPMAEIIRQVAARCDLTGLLAGDEHAELIANRLADLAGAEEAPGPGGETFWAVRRAFEALARERPVLLFVEDLHWAEPTLLDLIEYLVERVSGAPILVVGLARPELIDERDAWQDHEAVVLRPLSSEDGAALIENLGGVRDDLRARILRTAGGNPLFIEQLLAHATEDGEPEDLPPSLDALLASRLDRLGPGELSLLQRAAVVGRTFSRRAVTHLVPAEDIRAAERSLVALTAKGLIRESRLEAAPGEAFRFHHVLIRDAAYSTLPKGQRAELHKRVAEWLETTPGGPDELIGFHLEQAYGYLVELELVDAEALELAARAGERLAAAGLRAARSGDTPAAVTLLARSTSLLGPEEVVRRDLLTELGLVLWRAGDMQGAEETFDRAIEFSLSEHDRRAELRARTELANLRLRRADEGGAEALEALAEEAVPVLEQAGDDRALGRIWYALAGWYGALACQYGKAAEASERALESFRRSGWPLMPCLQELGACLYYGPTPVPEALLRCDELLGMADRGGEAQLLIFMAGLEAMAGRFDSGRALATRALEIYEDLAWTVNVWTFHRPIAADIELLAGNFAEAERLSTESCQMLETWDLRASLATQASQLGEAVYGQGRYDEAVRWSETAERCTAAYDRSAQFSWRALRAKALARLDSPVEADALAREGVAHVAVTDSVSQHAQVLVSHAEVLRLAGRKEEAAGAIDEAIVLLDEKANTAAGERARALLLEIA